MFKLHVGIVATDQWLGGVTYTHNLIRALSQLSEEERPRITLFCRGTTTLFEEVAPLADRVVVLPSPLRGAFEGTRWAATARRASSLFSAAVMQESLPQLARAAIREEVHAMYPACHSHSRHLPHPISWIPDLQHRAIPEYFSPMARAMRNRRFCSVLRDPDRHVVFSSNCSLQDATAAYGPLQSHNHILRFTTVPLNSWFDDPGAVVARYQLPEKFFIICNQFWMHKDHRTAFRALSKLKYRGIKAHLVCTGPTHDNRRPDYFPKLLNEIRELGIQDQVHILGTIPRIDQVALIRAAQAVIQPSCFEGWSTVIEDARALGRPVIASDFPVHLEQAAPLSSFFRLGDAADCARAMVEQVSTKRTSSYTLARHRARILEFARSFLKIVESACATSHSRETLIA